LKKRVLAVALICVFLALAMLFARENYGLEQTSNQNQVGAYYYAWWGMPENNHWNNDIKGTPFLGYYNSNDSRVADQQILLAKQHGINFFAVSWIGTGTWHHGDFSTIDQNLRNGLLEAPHLSDFKFCLFYETVLVKDNAANENQSFSDIFLNDINYAAQQYFSNPSYLKVDRSPILFIYNVPYLYVNSTEQEVHTLLDSARQEAATFGFNLYIIGDMNGGPLPPNVNSSLLYSLNATTSYHFDDRASNNDQVLNNATMYYPEWLSEMNSKGIGFVPDVFPGFNNTNNTGATEPWTVLPPNDTSLEQMTQIALNYSSTTPGFVMVTSWNEWMEGTQVEPSIERGDIFLNAINDAIINHDANFTPTQTIQPIPRPDHFNWLLIASFILGAIVATVIVTAYFLKTRKRFLERQQGGSTNAR